MNKTELINAVAKEAGLTKSAAAKTVDAVFNAISTSLSEGNSVKVPGFGTFEIRERAERTCTNPHTKEKIQVPASKSPAFKPSKTLKDKC